MAVNMMQVSSSPTDILENPKNPGAKVDTSQILLDGLKKQERKEV
jgi:hypothetical protein